MVRYKPNPASSATADEVVRSVSIVLHLANGQDVAIESKDEIEVLTDPDPEVTAILDDLPPETP